MSSLQRIAQPTPPGEVVVRQATPADHAAMRSVVRAAYRQYDGALPTRLWDSYLEDLLDLERHAREGVLLLAEVAGQVSACGTFHPDSSVQGVGWPDGWAGGRGLAVHPDARGLGLARSLLAECERRARAAGAPVFALHSASFMTTAMALYESAGYRRAPQYDVDLSRLYDLPDGTALAILAFRRDLSEVAAAAPNPCVKGLQ